MQNYRADASTETRLDYGVELMAGLQLFPETQALAPAFEQLHDELSQAHDARRALRAPLVKARVGVRLGNYTVDQTIRSSAKAAEIADGGRRGPVFKGLFPKGVGPVVSPKGKRQVKPTEALLERMSKSKLPAMAAFAAEWEPKIQAALAQLQGAVAAFEAARKAHDAAFQEEVGLRDEHRRRVDRLMGETRAAFPGDRARQDLVFPEPAESEAAAAEEAPEDGDTVLLNTADGAPSVPPPA